MFIATRLAKPATCFEQGSDFFRVWLDLTVQRGKVLADFTVKEGNWVKYPFALSSWAFPSRETGHPTDVPVTAAGLDPHEIARLESKRSAFIEIEQFRLSESVIAISIAPGLQLFRRDGSEFT